MALDATRQSLHAVAEQVLAGDLHRATGRIGLRVTPGGFGQPEYFVAGTRRRLRVDGTDLVILKGDTEERAPLTTLGAVATAAETVLAGPVGVYELLTDVDADSPLHLDAADATTIARLYAFGEQALEAVRRRHRAQRPTILQLWPEHLDLACSIGEVNVGVSPGDAALPEPYLYVGPWTVPSDPWWNEPWGRSMPWRPDVAADDAIAFFDEGLARAKGAS
jgi:hypothetical protein